MHIVNGFVILVISVWLKVRKVCATAWPMHNSLMIVIHGTLDYSRWEVQVPCLNTYFLMVWNSESMVLFIAISLKYCESK